MNKLKIAYQQYWGDKKLILSTIGSLLFLIAAMIINYYTSIYAFRSASNSVTDIIISNIRVYDLGTAFTNLTLIFFFFIFFLCLYRPQRIPFVLKSLALFIVLRSVFTSLTHIGLPASKIMIQSDLLSKLMTGGDLFFSGHTGMPFLLAMIFWEDTAIRNIFLLFSLIFAVIVLLAHMHYTIDVFAAFFITYTIFHIAKYLFKKDLQTFNDCAE